MFQNIKQKLEQFLQNRYGVDLLNKYLMGIVFLLLIIGIFVPIVSFLTIPILAYSYFRMFSKNIKQRGLENYKFVIFKNKVFRPFINIKRNLFGDKHSRYYKCPKCKQIIRVPKGKGKIEIRCPKCNERFIKRT